MSTDSGPKDSNSRPRARLVEEIRALIRSLRSLSTQIASRLVNGRLLESSESRPARASVPISELLTDHIAEASTASTAPGQADDGAAPEEWLPDNPSSDSFVQAPGTQRQSRGFTVFSALSKRFSGHHSSAHLQAFMREKMRKNTLDHVNKALALARHGNADGAKIHAGLAENAMRTAGEYMSDDDYAQFRRDVEHRMRATDCPD